MKHVLCWLRGHRWNVSAINRRKHVNLVHLHHMAGMRATCERCGEIWDDLFDSEGTDMWFGGHVEHVAPLPKAKVHR